MKRILSILSVALTTATAVFGQCSSTPNNYEIKLSQISANKLKVEMRYHADAVAAAYPMPSTGDMLDGLVFGVTWPNTSAAKIESIASSSKVFDLIQDENAAVQNKAVENIVTFYHNNKASVPVAFEAWKSDKWIELAVITFSGKLNNGDYFSLLNCDYGTIHPNSFHGNSTTDPWFAVLKANGIYEQYSPKMITELPSGVNTSFELFPVPTTGILNINVEVSSTTNAAIKVLDLNGRLVKTIMLDLEKGMNTTKIDIGDLAAGDYMIQLTDGKAINFAKQVTKN